MSSSNQHCKNYDDDESHLQQHRQHRQHRGHSFDETHHDDDDHHHHHHFNESSCDPCNATMNITNKACMEACHATMSSVDHMTMCGGVTFSNFHPSNYFTRNQHDHHHDHVVGDHHHANSPYLYTPNAPVGPSSCEYCGNRNTQDCRSNLPEEYNLLFMENSAKSADKNNINSNNSPNSRSSCSGGNNQIPCPRPKLFFLKKRPPFATPDGWNPTTEYRTNLFEPPSSVEGMGRGWGEVRGQLGNNSERTNNRGDGTVSPVANINPATASTPLAANGNNNNARSSYANSACGSSACGGAETEISDRATNISAGERSLSPVEWVSGLMGALSPS